MRVGTGIREAEAGRFGARLRRAGAQAVRDFTYLAVGLATSVIAMAVWIAGLSITLSLAVFIVGLPVFVLTAAIFRWTAELDRQNARLQLGRPLRGPYRDHGGGMWQPIAATARDPQTWKDFAWLVVHSVVGLGFGCAAVSAVGGVLAQVTLPLWFWALPADSKPDFGLWHVDTLPQALGSALLAIPLAVLVVLLLRIMAFALSRLATLLLEGDAAPAPASEAATPALPRPPGPRRDPRGPLSLHAALAALAGFICTLLWALTGSGYFWPVWVWLGLVLAVAVHATVARIILAAGDPGRRLRAKAELCGVIELVCLAVWGLGGAGYFWPVWPALGMGIALGVRALRVYWARLPWVRERELSERVGELTETRRGALDVQAAELRRIERDLHDGAQARLVALSMLIGRAEDQLDDRPEVAELVRRARAEAGAAIGELRDLARGIAPPVLADRGLVAAVEALGVRAPMEVTVTAGDSPRPPAVVETAAYFVVAEALTNVAKHAGGTPARVTIDRRGDRLVVTVSDEGPGGADPEGSGLGGLRQRVRAIDGELTVQSALGAGTTVRAELSCGS